MDERLERIRKSVADSVNDKWAKGFQPVVTLFVNQETQTAEVELLEFDVQQPGNRAWLQHTLQQLISQLEEMGPATPQV